jgi:tetratricopeptide (TPR) repeat protein
MSLVVLLGVASAADADDAKALYQKATGEFGVGNYEQAAAHFEAAFQLRPEPALLYNAAQAYRLAGKKQRALELYKNVVRLYAASPQAVEAKRHIANLSQQLTGERGPAPAPPPPPAPPSAAVAPPTRAPDPAPRLALAPPPPAPAAAVVSAPAPSPPATTADRRSIFASPWLWVGAGLALLGGAAAVVLATHPSYPNPSWGSGNAN